MKKCKAAVYIDAINLAKIVYFRRLEMPKCDRYEMGREIFNLSYRLIQSIVVTNNEKNECNRMKHMDESVVPCWEQIKALLTLAIELDMYKLNTAATIAEILEKIDNGVYSWRTYISKRCS